MKRFLFILTLSATLFAVVHPCCEVKAMDPVTIAILAPIAIKAAQILMPYVLRGLASMGKTGIKAGKELINFFRLPIGIGLCMFWQFKAGFKQIARGFCAPFKMGFYLVMLPFSGFIGAF